MSEFILAILLLLMGAYAYSQRERRLKQQHRFTLELSALGAQKDKLAHQAALNFALGNAAYDAIFVVNKNAKILCSNISATELFFQSSHIGKTIVEIVGAPELAMMVEDASLREGEAFEEQLMINGNHYRVKMKMSQQNGDIIIGVALQDITRLVRLNRARRDMVANISHELRTPIANIRLIIDGLFHDQEKPKRKDSISSLRDIAQETDNLLWLVQGMSDLSMIESGQAIVRLIEVPLIELVDEAIVRLIDQADKKRIKLVRHVPEKLNVLCDRDLIKRVVVNLIHNSLKWSPPDNAITISVYHENDEEFIIQVVDNGPGVPQGAVDRIFERFYQVDEARSSGEGTGLGLAICKHIVEAHGGRIWAESNADGSGGKFMFTLLNAGQTEPDEDQQEGMTTPK